jgi:membrane protease YdiL (CAAX protease family)
MNGSRGVLVFLLLSFGLAWAAEAVFLRRLPAGSHLFPMAVGALTLVPAASALLVRAFVERSGFRDAGLGWGRGARWYLLAWLLPIALGWTAMLLSLAFRQAQYDPYLAELMGRMQLTFPAMRMPPVEAVRVGLVLSSLTYAIIPSTVGAFAEEFAWRGYLLVRLRPLGALPAAAVTGALWGLWYAPLVSLGYAYPRHPLVGVPLVVGFCTLSGVILGWLRLASGSVFAAAVARGSFKGPAQTPLAFTTGRAEFAAGPFGLIGQAVMLIFVLGLWRAGARRSREPVAPGEEDAGEFLPEQVEQ